MGGQTVAILGAPTSAAAHGPGQEKAPAALRSAGLIDAIEKNGLPYLDLGDLPVSLWRSDRQPFGDHKVNALGTVCSFAELVRDRVAQILKDGLTPLVLGGDCTITVGAVAGSLAAGLTPGLVYVDGGWDLSNPCIYPAGILDSMGLGHMLDLPGSTELAAIAPVRPMIQPDWFVQFGHGPGATDGPEERLAQEHGFFHIPNDRVEGRAEDAATEALAMLHPDLESFWLHFDVDVVDFFDMPLADIPLLGNGLAYADAITAVSTFARDPRCVGMTVTELNPDHAVAVSGTLDRVAHDLASVALGLVERT